MAHATETVQASIETAESIMIGVTMYASRDVSTGCWTLHRADLETVELLIGGTTTVVAVDECAKSATDRSAMLRECERQWWKLERLFEDQHQADLTTRREEFEERRRKAVQASE